MTLREAVAIIEAELPIEDINIKRRVERAYGIVTSQGYTVHQVSADVWHVSRASTSLFEDNSQTYKVSLPEHSCTCPDFGSVRGGLCKHRIAVMILQEMQREHV